MDTNKTAQRLDEICSECMTCKKVNSPKRQMELKRDYAKIQQDAYPMATMQVANSIHKCYISCDANIKGFKRTIGNIKDFLYLNTNKIKELFDEQAKVESESLEKQLDYLDSQNTNEILKEIEKTDIIHKRLEGHSLSCDY